MNGMEEENWAERKGFKRCGLYPPTSRRRNHLKTSVSVIALRDVHLHSAVVDVATISVSAYTACTAYFAAITVLYKYQLSLIDPRGKIVL